MIRKRLPSGRARFIWRKANCSMAASLLPETIAEGSFGGVETTHAVHAAAGRRRRGAQIKPGHGGTVRRWAEYRPRQQLPQIRCAVVDVTADEVGIFLLHSRAVQRVPRQDAVAEAGREPLDLVFYLPGHVER